MQKQFYQQKMKSLVIAVLTTILTSTLILLFYIERSISVINQELQLSFIEKGHILVDSSEKGLESLAFKFAEDDMLEFLKAIVEKEPLVVAARFKSYERKVSLDINGKDVNTQYAKRNLVNSDIKRVPLKKDDVVIFSKVVQYDDGGKTHKLGEIEFWLSFYHVWRKIDKARSNFLWLAFLGFLFLVGICSMLYFYIRRRSTESSAWLAGVFSELNSAMKAIAAGDYSYRLEVGWIDDTGELVDNYEEMRIALLASTKKLEVTLKERRKSLKEAQQRELVCAHKAVRGDIAKRVLHDMWDLTDSFAASLNCLVVSNKNTSIDKILELIGFYKTFKSREEEFCQSDERAHKLFECILSLESAILKDRFAMNSQISTLSKKLRVISSTLRDHEVLEKGDSESLASVGLSKLVKSSSDICRFDIMRSGIILENNLENLPEVEINVKEFTNALVSIIQNAIEATCKTISRIRVLKISTFKDQNFMYIDFCYSGNAPLREKHEKMFYFSDASEPSWHGSNLYYAAKIITELNGELRLAYCERSENTTIKVCLPIKTSE